MVTGAEPRPLTLRTLLNQTVSPAGIAVPLKFEAIELTVGVIRSSRTSTSGRMRSGRRAGRRRAGGKSRLMEVPRGQGTRRFAPALRELRHRQGGKGRFRGLIAIGWAHPTHGARNFE